jgi:hypothetical protein
MFVAESVQLDKAMTMSEMKSVIKNLTNNKATG